MAEAYNDMTDAQRAAWKKANPDKKKTVYAINDLLFKGIGTDKVKTGIGKSAYTGYSRMYPSGVYVRPGRRSGGGGYGGGGYYAPPAAPPTPIPPVVTPPQPGPQQWTYDDYRKALDRGRQDDPGFDPLVMLMFGRDIMTIAASYFGMTAEQRATWLKDNPNLWARLLRYLQWLSSPKAPGETGRIAASIPPGVALSQQSAQTIQAPVVV